jgi:hypothetical protein
MHHPSGFRSASFYMELVKNLMNVFGRSGRQASNWSPGPKHILCLEALECRKVPSILWDNGPFVTGMGNGFGGADTSAVEMGAQNFGYTVGEEAFHVADDFTVSDESGWAVSSLSVYAYQTGSSTTSTFTGVFLTLWDGPPGRYGSVLVGRSGNLFSDSAWTGAYRVPLNDPQLHDRPIMSITADLSKWEEFPNPLPPGSYWVEWGLIADALLAGPFAVPTTPLGIADNARQYNVSTDRWSGVYDFGLGETRDFPFQVEGEVAGNRARIDRFEAQAALRTSVFSEDYFFLDYRAADIADPSQVHIAKSDTKNADNTTGAVPQSAVDTDRVTTHVIGNGVMEITTRQFYTSLPDDSGLTLVWAGAYPSSNMTRSLNPECTE